MRTRVFCYVYLSDVKGKAADALQKSRWFTRGWTLQELLAPRNVIFYDATWEQIGRLVSELPESDEEAEFRCLIADLSRIPTTELGTGKWVQSNSVAQKMSWAAHRETTRPEDMAYCMLGILDVNMPLLYGEGGQKAFRRLQEEIMRHSADHTLFAWETADTPKYRTTGGSGLIIEAPGLLATSPKCFAECRNSGVKVPKGRKVSHYFITNIGVYLNLPWRVLPGTQPEVGLAALNWADYKTKYSQCRAMPLLVNSAVDGRHYRSPWISHIMAPKDFFDLAEVKSIYVNPGKLHFTRMFTLMGAWKEPHSDFEIYPPDWACTRQSPSESWIYRSEISRTPVVILRGRMEGDELDFLIRVTMANLAQQDKVLNVSLGAMPQGTTDFLMELVVRNDGNLDKVVEWGPRLQLDHPHRKLTVNVALFSPIPSICLSWVIDRA